MRNRTYGGVRGRKTKSRRKTTSFSSYSIFNTFLKIITPQPLRGSGFSGAKIRRKNEIRRENRRKSEKNREIICKSSVISARIVQFFHSKAPVPPGSFTFLPLKVLFTLLPLKVLFISYWYASSLSFLHIDERYPFSQLYSLMSEP